MSVDDELEQLRGTLEGALGTAGNDAVEVDEDWRGGWQALADLGITGFCASEETGGFGLRADAAATTAMTLGAALHGSPFAGMTAAVRALTSADPSDPLAKGIVDGSAVVAWGQLSAGGTARMIDGGEDADALVLVDVRRGDLVVLEQIGAWSVVGSHPFDVSRRCVDLAVDGGAGRSAPTDSVATSLFGLLLAADSIGCVERSLARTVAYVKQRIAFGKALGGFQAVQHRLVDHAVRSQGSRLLVAEAALAITAGRPEAQRLVAMAEVSVSSSASHILHDLLQLTGAIGFTWEYGLHLHERRAHQNARLGGNPRSASAVLAAIEGWR